MLIVGVLACEVSSVVPTLSPTTTPDRVATGVAEQKAIAATLTIEAVSRVTQTPFPSKTIGTPTAIRLSEWKFVQGNVYGIKVIKVEKGDFVILKPSGAGYDIASSPSADETTLQVTVQFFKNEVALEVDLNKEIYEQLSILGPDGEKYKPIPYYQQPIVDGKPACMVQFYVPKSRTGFRIQYRDLPLIDLGK